MIKRFQSLIQDERSKNIIFWVIVIRGFVAITLGVVLLFLPEKTIPLLANFMGFFWLMSGILSLRAGIEEHQDRRISIVAGIIGIITGLVVIINELWGNFFEEKTVLVTLGIVIFLTGILHMFGGFRRSGETKRQWSWDSFILGAFEIILGGVLVTAPLEQYTLTYLTASIWALVGGIVIIGDALRLRARN